MNDEEKEARKAELRKIKEELRAKNPEGGKVTVAEAEAYKVRQEEFRKMSEGFKVFCGMGLTVANEVLPKLLPTLFIPVEVSESEKELVGDAFTTYLERHAESFIESAPGYMLAGSLFMFTLPRLKIAQPKTDEPKSSVNNGEDGDGKKPPGSEDQTTVS